MSRKLSKLGSAATIIATTFGTGILFMPAGFRLLGYAYALVALACVSLLTYFALYSLTYAAIATNSTEEASYSNLAASFSVRFKRLIDVTMLGRNMGITTVLTRYFCTNAARMLKNLGMPGDPELVRRLCLVLFVLAVVYFGMKDSLASLSFISRISLAGVLCYLLSITYYALAYGHPVRELRAVSDGYGSGVVKFVFALHCQFSYLNVFNEMQEKSLPEVSGVIALACAGIGLIYAASGFFGYMAAGEAIGERQILEVFGDRNDPLMQRISRGSADKYGVVPGLVISCFLFVWFGFIVFASFPTITLIQKYLSSGGKPARRGPIVLATGAFLLVGGLPAELQITKLLSLSAALFTNPLSFVYPSIFMILVSPRLSLRSLLAYALIACSLVLMLNVVYTVAAG